MCDDGAPYERGIYVFLRFRKILLDYLKGAQLTDRRTFIRYLHLVILRFFHSLKIYCFRRNYMMTLKEFPQ